MKRRKCLTAQKTGSVSDILKGENVNPETVLVFLKDRPVPDDLRVRKGTKLKMLEITSSG